MQDSIIDILNKYGYDTRHLLNDPLILKIDELLKNNNCLGVFFTNSGTINIRKKLKYKNQYKYNYRYNIQIRILETPYSWAYHEELLGKMGIPVNASYIYEGLLRILKNKQHRSNISEDELKLIKDKKDKEEEEEFEAFTEYFLNKINNKDSISNHNTNHPVNDIKELNDEDMSDDDPFSERSIMRDLENGEGEKHGF